VYSFVISARIFLACVHACVFFFHLPQIVCSFFQQLVPLHCYAAICGGATPEEAAASAFQAAHDSIAADAVDIYENKKRGIEKLRTGSRARGDQNQTPSLFDFGTTANVIIHYDDVVVTANAGDSRCVSMRRTTAGDGGGDGGKCDCGNGSGRGGNDCADADTVGVVGHRVVGDEWRLQCETGRCRDALLL
jgi:hypothetical protein